MPITIDLTGASIGQCQVQISPLLELMAAMHVLTEVDHHPLRHDFAAQLRATLGDELVERAHSFSPLWSRFRCRLFFVSSAGAHSFEAQVASLREMPLEQFSELAAEGILGMGRAGDHAALLAEPDALVAACRKRSSARAELATRLVADADGFREQLLDFLEQVWAVAFHDEWRRLAPALAVTLERLHMQLRKDIPATVAQLSPTAAIIGESARVRFDKLDTAHFAINDAQLVLVPSVLQSPHLTIKYAPGGDLVIVFPGGASHEELSLEQLRERLQAFGSPLRMGMLRHLLGEELTTSELTLRLGVDATQISRALTILRTARVVVSARSGGVIRHRADVDAIRRLGGDVLATIMR